MTFSITQFLFLCSTVSVIHALAPLSTSASGGKTTARQQQQQQVVGDRRAALGWMGTATAGLLTFANPAFADGERLNPDSTVDNFLRAGGVPQPMGVSGQAGKSKPETGVIFRDGSELARNSKSGNVLTELILNSPKKELLAAVVTFSSPWALATGSVFDVECRESDTGDSAFLSVTGNVDGKPIDQIPDSFFVKQLVKPTGRFSFYGAPTDVKVKNSVTVNNYRIFDLSFSTLAQSTQMEIPRKARVVATIPEGSSQAVMLVASASAIRWKNKGSEQKIEQTIQSFRAAPAPKSNMKIRAKEQYSNRVED